MDESHALVVAPDEAGLRLDAWLARERPKEGSKTLRTVRTDETLALTQEAGVPIIHVMKLEHR